MEQDIYERTRLLIGGQNIDYLMQSKIAIFGLGGVGSYTVEMLSRCAVGSLILVDNDTIEYSNINRQLFAMYSTYGQAKVDVAYRRIKDINPSCNVTLYKTHYGVSTRGEVDLSSCQYIIDAIDDIEGKLTLIQEANRLQIPIISCMGAGQKLDPMRFEVSDIFNTSVCPLCRVMRSRLRALNIAKLKVVYSKEKPLPLGESKTIGSISFTPSVAGILLAKTVIFDLLKLPAT